MKKVFIILALAIFSFANAQKGTVLVAGSVGFSSVKQINSKYENFYFSPKVGYQFNDNWTVGGEMSIFRSSNGNNYATPSIQFISTSQNGFSIGPFVRYSKSLSDTFAFYTDLGIGYSKAKNDNIKYNGPSAIYSIIVSKGNGFYANITPALFINVKKGFGLNFNIGGLGYETLNYDNNGGDNNQFVFNFGQTASIGISKNF